MCGLASFISSNINLAKDLGAAWIMSFSDQPALTKIMMGQDFVLARPHQMLVKDISKGEK